MNPRLASFSLAFLVAGCAHAQQPAVDAHGRPAPRLVDAKCEYGPANLKVHPPNPARWMIATRPDSQLVAAKVGRIVVTPYAAGTRTFSENIFGRLRGANLQIGGSVDSAGLMRMDASPGTYSLVVLAVGLEQWRDSVKVRIGFADTVDIGLADAANCLFPMSLGITPRPPA